jgi:hypothetical protein
MTLDKSQKICVLLPTRMRPDGFRKALDSYLKNKTERSDIYFSFQNPEATHLQENFNILKERNLLDKVWLLGNIGLTNKINFLVEKNDGYGAYMILNDDQIIHTKDFDEILWQKLEELEKKSGHRLWILHWKDGIQDEKLCQSFLTKEMKDILGSYYPKGFMRHLYSDNMYHFIGGQCGILNYMPNIFIEHNHFINKKAEVDQSYQESNSQEAYARDGNFYAKWLIEHGYNTCEKILNIVEKDEQIRKIKLEGVKQAIKDMTTPPEKK